MNDSNPEMHQKEPMVAPSIFAADFYDLSRAVGICEYSHVDMIHYDVMDNHFTSNISFGPKVIGDIISKTCLPADVHLMISLDDTGKLSPYLNLPVQHITIHIESIEGKVESFIDAIRKSGKTAGLSVKPRTDINVLAPYIDMIDLVLVMSVEPGYSGQSFLPVTLERLQQLRKMTIEKTPTVQVDGGITRNNYEEVIESGADCLVIGHHFFEDGNTLEWVKDIKKVSILF